MTTRNVNSNTYFKSAVPLQGWMFDFSDILRTYIVKQYGHWAEYKATDKTGTSQFSYTAGWTASWNLTNDTAMTATVNFRQMAQYIGLAICTLIMRTAFWVSGILWYIVREIINGVFRVAIGVIVAILSVILFFGFILWVIHPLIPTDMAKRRSRQWSNNADTTRWATSSSTWWKHTSTAICPSFVDSTTN